MQDTVGRRWKERFGLALGVEALEWWSNAAVQRVRHLRVRGLTGKSRLTVNEKWLQARVAVGSCNIVTSIHTRRFDASHGYCLGVP